MDLMNFHSRQRLRTSRSPIVPGLSLSQLARSRPGVEIAVLRVTDEYIARSMLHESTRRFLVLTGGRFPTMETDPKTGFMVKEALQEVVGEELFVTDKITKSLSLFRGIVLSDFRPRNRRESLSGSTRVWAPDQLLLLADAMNYIFGYPGNYAEGAATHVVQAFHLLYQEMSTYWTRNAKELTGVCSEEQHNSDEKRVRYSSAKLDTAFSLDMEEWSRRVGVAASKLIADPLQSVSQDPPLPSFINTISILRDTDGMGLAQHMRSFYALGRPERIVGRAAKGRESKHDVEEHLARGPFEK